MTTTRTLDDDQFVDYLFDHDKGFLEEKWLELLDREPEEKWVELGNWFMNNYGINLRVVSVRAEDDLFIWEVTDQ